MAKATIQVSIDQRCELGTHYSFAERGNATIVQKPTRCLVRKDCGQEIAAGEAGVIWYFARRNINNTVVGVLCNRCDAEMVEVADSEVNA
jgi:hypothetical protein